MSNIKERLAKVDEVVTRYTAGYPKSFRKGKVLKSIEDDMKSLLKDIKDIEDGKEYNRLIDKLTNWYIDPRFLDTYTKRKPRLPDVVAYKEPKKEAKEELVEMEIEQMPSSKKAPEKITLSTPRETPSKLEPSNTPRSPDTKSKKTKMKSREVLGKEDKPASAKQDETRMGSKPASAKQDETRMGSKPASAKQDETRMGSKPASAKQDETRMGSKPKPPRDVEEMDLDDIEDVDVEEMDLDDNEDVDVEEMDLDDIEDVVDMKKEEMDIDPEMEEFHNQIRKEEREKVMREFNLVNSTIGSIDIPKERLGIEGKTIKILNDDIKYFINRFPDMLKMEATVYKKTNKKNKKALQDLHRRIQAKLSPNPKKEREDEKVGIILDADKFIDMKITELLATKTLEGLTPANLVDITEEPKSKNRDVGSYTLTRMGGRDIISNAPVYRAIPTTQPKQPKGKGEIKQSTIYENSGKTKVDIAKMELKDNPFIRKQNPKRLNIIL